MSPASLYAKEWVSDEFCTCELLVKAKQNNRVEPNLPEAVYAVVPAHLVMSGKHKKDAAAAGYDVSHARQNTEQFTTSQRYTCIIQVGSDAKKLDLRHPPLLGYRQWCVDENERCPAQYNRCSDNSVCPHRFLNDIALLQLDNDDSLSSEIPQSNDVKPPSKIFTARLTDLGKLKDQPIVIGENIGKITAQHMSPEISAKQTGEFYGHHISFVLTSRDTMGKIQ